MCGFTGIFAFNEVGRFFSINLAASAETLERRGPDSGYTYIEGKTSMAHRRLAIIDTSSDGRQPMTDASGRYTLAYNGEIYNFKALRAELEADGVPFRSHTDTEVLLYLYIKHGQACLDKLNGFFAFAVHDKETDELFLARDRFGIKPLYWFMDEDKFLFASEMRALLAFGVPREMDYASFLLYLQLNYIPAPHTIFEGVQKLPPGHCMTVRKRQTDIRRYYQIKLPEAGRYSPASYEATQKQLLKLLEEAVVDRLVADVPLGTFLSGGIDSSAVSALAARHVKGLKTFSVGFRDEPLFDETRYAKLVADKHCTDHTVFNLGNDDFYEHLFDLLDYFGEPFADASALPVFILSQRTRKRVTVALSGDGADEVFAGYNKYLGEYKARQGGATAALLSAALPLLRKLPKTRNSFIGNKVRQAHRFAESLAHAPQDRYWFLCSWRTLEASLALLTPEAREKVDASLLEKRKQEYLQGLGGEDFNEVLAADMNLLLPNDMLHKVDAMSMANSLEVRVPFLDHRLVEFAFGLPPQYKLNGKMKKRVLQDAVRDLLPPELYRRPKRGFDAPLAVGFKKELRSWIENDMLEDEFVAAQGLFDPAAIREVKRKVFETNDFDQAQVWGLLAFQHWHKKYGAPSE